MLVLLCVLVVDPWLLSQESPQRNPPGPPLVGFLLSGVGIKPQRGGIKLEIDLKKSTPPGPHFWGLDMPAIRQPAQEVAVPTLETIEEIDAALERANAVPKDERGSAWHQITDGLLEQRSRLMLAAATAALGG